VIAHREKGTVRIWTCATVESVDEVVDAEERRARFEAVAREILDPLRRFLARRTDTSTADDVLAETLLVLWRRYDVLPDDPLPYSYGVARLCLANAERGARRQRRLAGRIATVDPPREEPEPVGDDRLAEAMATLGDDDAEVLRLWAWEQLTSGEIATVLKITANAAGIRLHRAKQRLRDALRKIEAPGGHEEANDRGSR
jgi:RNA polymerase sigma-70 factor, ECF subfamily